MNNDDIGFRLDRLDGRSAQTGRHANLALILGCVGGALAGGLFVSDTTLAKSLVCQ